MSPSLRPHGTLPLIFPQPYEIGTVIMRFPKCHVWGVAVLELKLSCILLFFVLFQRLSALYFTVLLPNYRCPCELVPQTQMYLAAQTVKTSFNAGDPGSILGSGRSPGEGNCNPLQYSCLGNPMDREARWAIVHGVTKSQTQLSE